MHGDGGGESRFVIPGPVDGRQVMAEFGSRFPSDSAAYIRRQGGTSSLVQWADVAQLTLDDGDELILPGIPVAAGPLMHVLERLLGPDGCPWDREQTPLSLLRYLLDESYEAAEALVAGDWAGFEDELGDVLLQVAFHGALLPGTSFEAISARQAAKLVRRHPHVFQRRDDEELSSAQVRERWEDIKAGEQPRERRADWVFPALVLAKRMAKRGVRPDTPAFQAALDLIGVYGEREAGKIEEILADVAWAAAEAGRIHHRDAEWALWQRLVELDEVLGRGPVSDSGGKKGFH